MLFVSDDNFSLDKWQPLCSAFNNTRKRRNLQYTKLVK
jgi:hypothetical protein